MHVCFQLYLHNSQLLPTKAIVLTALLLFAKFHNNPDKRSRGISSFFPVYLAYLYQFSSFLHENR